jgi:hypothetical protein
MAAESLASPTAFTMATPPTAGGVGDCAADGGGVGDDAADGSPPAYAMFELDPKRALAVLARNAGVFCARGATELITLTVTDPAAASQQFNDSMREQRISHRTCTPRFLCHTGHAPKRLASGG